MRKFSILNPPTVKTKLRLGRWMEETSTGYSPIIVETYMSASKDLAEWEKIYYYIGSHYSNTFENERLSRSMS